MRLLLDSILDLASGKVRADPGLLEANLQLDSGTDQAAKEKLEVDQGPPKISLPPDLGSDRAAKEELEADPGLLGAHNLPIEATPEIMSALGSQNLAPMNISFPADSGMDQVA